MSLISRTTFLIIAGFLVIVAGCNDPIERRELNKYKAQNRYVEKQDLVTQTAFLAMEVDGNLRYDFTGNLEEGGGGYASGFLISRSKGLFKTAYHFTEHLGENGLDWCRLFINGRVYRAELYRALSNRDSAVIKIIDNFSETDFPEAPVFSSRKVKVRDKVFIEGYHPHPYYIRLKDQESGKKFQLIPLLKNYYQTVNVDKEDYTEIVYEVLEAKVVKDVVTMDELLKPEQRKPEDLLSRLHTFFEIKTKDDHLFSFGGLSGTLVKNDRGEVVGEVTMELRKQGEENRIIYVTPIESEIDEIKDLVGNYQR
ncbi:MAG TPA: hypothetical protein VJC06_01210 [Candidatus Paceibacterota bacterium]